MLLEFLLWACSGNFFVFTATSGVSLRGIVLLKILGVGSSFKGGFVWGKSTSECLTIRPYVGTFPMLLVVFVLPWIAIIFLGFPNTFSIKKTMLEISLVYGAICPQVLPSSAELASFELPFVEVTVVEVLLPLPILLASQKGSFIDISHRVNQKTLALSFPFLPVAFI